MLQINILSPRRLIGYFDRAIAHDKNVYENPMSFNPERYLDKEGNLVTTGTHSDVWSFGFGRRYVKAGQRVSWFPDCFLNQCVPWSPIGKWYCGIVHSSFQLLILIIFFNLDLAINRNNFSYLQYPNEEGCSRKLHSCWRGYRGRRWAREVNRNSSWLLLLLSITLTLS